MKKLIILAAILVSVSSFSYAIEVNKKIIASFNNHFCNASNVQWKALEDVNLYEAHFTYNGEQINAYYNEDGELVSTARYINKANLPLLIARQIQEQYPDYLIRTIIESNKENDISYYITLVSPKKSLIVSTTGDRRLSVFKKFKTY